MICVHSLWTSLEAWLMLRILRLKSVILVPNIFLCFTKVFSLSLFYWRPFIVTRQHKIMMAGDGLSQRFRFLWFRLIQYVREPIFVWLGFQTFIFLITNLWESFFWLLLYFPISFLYIFSQNFFFYLFFCFSPNLLMFFPCLYICLQSLNLKTFP